ncbi:MAG: phosphatidylinositol-specific phospholipase C/glycerophosphodiester phosphodiesterase family protein [Chitinophagaceae bacterium]
MKIKMDFKQLWMGAFLSLPFVSIGQNAGYSLNKVHSHNDYWQSRPFYLAYEHGLGSVEADTYLWDGALLVAHDTVALKKENTLQHLYLEPLKAALLSHGGHPFADTSLHIQLLIELKTEADTEIKAMETALQQYPEITDNPQVQVVFTGNTPSVKAMLACPTYMRFDGQLSHTYPPEALAHIAMLSDNLQDFITWDGKGKLTQKQEKVLRRWVKKGHDLGKKVRFWNAPDNPLAWETFMRLGVDYINTDHIEAVTQFFEKLNQKQ